MDLKKAQEYIKALKNGEKFPKKNMFLIMFLLGALLFVIVLPTGSSAPTSEKGGLDENKRKENKNSQTGEYETYIEEKTSSVLSQVKGAGKVTAVSYTHLDVYKRQDHMSAGLPRDPVMLLSVVNTKLRDYYSTLDVLCEDMQVDKQELIGKLEMIDYTYDAGSNQFV